MIAVRNLRWFFVGVSIGLILMGVEALVSSTKGYARHPSPAPVGDIGMQDRVVAGLRIECRNDDECLHTSRNDWNDGRGPALRKFLRLRVYNDGHRPAEGCSVTLQSITEITPTGLVSTNFAGPCLLIWSGDQSARREGKVIRQNANPEVVDLCYTVHHPGGDEIYVKDDRYDSFLRFGKSYRFEVVATGESVEAVRKNINVKFGPTWGDVEVVSD